MKFKMILWLLLAASVAFAGGSWAQMNAIEIAAKETGVQKVQYIDGGQTVYVMRWTLERVRREGKEIIVYKLHGDNAKEGAARIEWDEESLIDITSAGLRTRLWKKRSTGAEQMDWKLVFNWAARQAQYSFQDRATGKNENKTMKFQADAIPGDCMNLILRGFPFEKGAGYEMTGQIVNVDGSLLGGRIINRGVEKLPTAFGAIEAYKLELKPTGALGLVAPKMWMWYTKAQPHVWLRFDGRDDGLTNPRTKNELVEYQPRVWIK